MASIINAATSGGLVTSADTSGVLQLQTASTTAVTVTASQNVGIGVTSPGAKLHVTSSASSGIYGAIIYNQSATGQGLTVRAGSTSSEDTFNCQTYDGGLSLFTILGNGNVVIPTGTLKTVSTISVGNATPSTSGAGITFPADQSILGASSNANTLDDYEEGTFTPTVLGTSPVGTASYGFQYGAYVKVGKLVSFQIYMDWSSGTGGGNLFIGGLPFTSANNTTYPAVSLGYVNDITLTANATPLAIVNNNDTRIYFYQVPSGGGANIQIPYDSSGTLIIAGTYQSAS